MRTVAIGSAVLSVMRQVLFAVLKIAVGLAILAVAVFLFVPHSGDYGIRSRVSEALSMAASAKVAIGDSYRRTGKLPADNQAAGLPPPMAIRSGFVTSVTIRNGAIFTRLSDRIGGHPSMDGVTLVLKPTKVTPEGIEWQCAVVDDRVRYNKYVPSECRN